LYFPPHAAPRGAPSSPPRSDPDNTVDEQQAAAEQLQEQSRQQQRQFERQLQRQASAASAPPMAGAAPPPPLPPPAAVAVLVAAKAGAAAAARASLSNSLRALAGSNANLAQCVAMGFISLFCSLSAISVVATNGGKGADMALVGFYLLAIVLLATGVLQMAKTTRDQRMAEVFTNEFLAPQLVGTAAARVMNLIAVAASFSLAVAIVVVMAVASGAPGEGSGFLLMSIAFLLTAVINLSKAWRDRFDSLFLERAAELQPARVAELARAVHSLELTSHVFYMINAVSAMLSTAATIAAIAVSQERLDWNTKALLILALLFMVASAVNASKLVRDELEQGSIKPTAQWKAITILATVISLGAVFGVIANICKTSPPSFCALLYVGALWMLASVVTLSKITRDRDEKLRAAAASGIAH